MKRGFLFLAGMLSASLSVAAEEYPTTGIVYNTKETHSLTYRCSLTKLEQLSCEFTQTAVRHKKNKEDLETETKELIAEFRTKGRDLIGEEFCANTPMMLDVLEGRMDPPAGKDALLNTPPQQKQDILQIVRSIFLFCKEPTEDNARAVFEAGFSKDARTCLVSANSFEQTFIRVEDYSPGPARWVAQSSPEGTCGIVSLNRFEPVAGGAVGFVFWNFVYKKSITNPTGTIMGLGSCSELDENEYLYEWKNQEKYMGCDYIEFSPL